MSLDIQHALDGAATWLCSAPIVTRVVSNPIFTALLITALAAVVLMGVYRYCAWKAGWKKAARAAIYLLLVVSAVVFVHHYAVMHKVRSESLQEGVRSVFNSINDAGVRGGAEHPVDLPFRAAGPEDAVSGGGAPAPPCPCQGAALGAAERPALRPDGLRPGPRPDNIRQAAPPANIQLGGAGAPAVTIADVMVPSTQTPL